MTAATSGRRCLVQVSDLGSQPLDQRPIESPLFRDMIEQRCLVEALHFEEPVDDLAFAAQSQSTVVVAGYRKEPPVEVRRRSDVEAVFGLEDAMSFFDRREIEKAVANCAFEFVRAVADQEDDRGMGVDALDS